MNRVPPFVGNSDDDMHCVTAVYRMLYLHFFHEQYSWEQIEDLARAVPGKGTWTFVADTELAKRGIQIINIEPVDYEALFAQGPKYLRTLYGDKMADYYLERSNIGEVIKYIPEFLKTVQHETRRSTLREVLGFVKSGKLVGVEINSSILNKQKGFNLHFVLIYDCTKTHVIFHDPGLPPMPSRKISIKRFKECFEHAGGSASAHIYENPEIKK